MLCTDLCTKGPLRQLHLEELNSNNGSYDVCSFVCVRLNVCIHSIYVYVNMDVHAYKYEHTCISSGPAAILTIHSTPSIYRRGGRMMDCYLHF